MGGGRKQGLMAYFCGILIYVMLVFLNYFSMNLQRKNVKVNIHSLIFLHQTPPSDTKMLLKVIFDKTALVEFLD
jgi:hypothetical protein